MENVVNHGLLSFFKSYVQKSAHKYRRDWPAHIAAALPRFFLTDEQQLPRNLPAVRACGQSLQKDLLKRMKQRQDCDKLGQEITELHEKKYQLQLDDAKKDGVRQKISDLKAFLDEQETQIVEYDEALVRRLIERITVHDDHFTVEFKSGVGVEVNG